MYRDSEMSSVCKVVNQPKHRVLALALLGAFGLIVANMPSALAQDKTFLPSGHTYAPNDERLPYPNSRRDRLQAEADVYETEIYRRQLEQSKTNERFRRFRDHDFFSPDQLQ